MRQNAADAGGGAQNCYNVAMKTVGIIAEYNPFHQGHARQYELVRERFGADAALAVVMSGNFTQRGEPAVVDKWARTRMALTMGASLVIELPFAYAAASAERFATGGVQCLLATGVVGHLAFGSESGDLPALDRAAAILTEEPPAFKAALRDGLDSGLAFPAARQQALAACLEDPSGAAILSTSNNILAVEYLKAIRRHAGGRLKPWTHGREGQAYRGQTLAGLTGPASATAIRSEIRRCGRNPAALLTALSGHMPAAALGILVEQAAAGRGPVFPESLAPSLLSLLGSHSGEELDAFAGMEEGLGRRLKQMAARPAKASPDLLQDLLDAADTRRFPATRISRALTALLAGVRREDLAQLDAAGGPQYLRVLGFDRKGRYLLKLMRQHAALPILTKGSDFLEMTQPAAVRLAQLDRLSTDLWSLAAGLPAGADFDTPVITR